MAGDAIPNVFISYSSRDDRWADAACAVLEANGVPCWVAPRDIAPGAEWGASIIAGIDGCRVMVLVFSGNANRSPQVRREVERAVSKGHVILTYRVEDVRPEGAMEYALSNTHWLNAFAGPAEDHLAKLVAAVRAVLAEVPQPRASAGASEDGKPAAGPHVPRLAVGYQQGVVRRRRPWARAAGAALVVGLGFAAVYLLPLRTARVKELEQQLHQRDDHLADLEQQLQQRQARLTELEKQAHERDVRDELIRDQVRTMVRLMKATGIGTMTIGPYLDKILELLRPEKLPASPGKAP
jgi:hypothetical protein